MSSETKIETRHAELKRAKKKSRGFSVNRLSDKWRDEIYEIAIIYPS